MSIFCTFSTYFSLPLLAFKKKVGLKEVFENLLNVEKQYGGPVSFVIIQSTKNRPFQTYVTKTTSLSRKKALKLDFVRGKQKRGR